MDLSPKSKIKDFHDLTVDECIKGMRSAFVLEQIGGKSALDSILFPRCIYSLMHNHGFTKEQIVKLYKEKYPDEANS